MYYHIMMEQEQPQGNFTHPREFICVANDNEVDATIREHGFTGNYVARKLPSLLSKTYRNK